MASFWDRLEAVGSAYKAYKFAFELVEYIFKFTTWLLLASAFLFAGQKTGNQLLTIFGFALYASAIGGIAVVSDIPFEFLFPRDKKRIYYGWERQVSIFLRLTITVFVLAFFAMMGPKILDMFMFYSDFLKAKC